MINIPILLVDFLLCLINIFIEILKSICAFFLQFLNVQSKSLEKEIVLVTGAASGIGRSLCIKLSDKKSIVIGVDIDFNGLNETKNIVEKLTERKMFIYTCDVRFRENITKLRENIEREVGRVDIVINNAGIVHGKSVLQLSVEEIKETFDVNLFSNFFTVQEFLPSMLERSHGHLVFVSSIAGYVTSPLLSDYCASKAAVNLLAETLLSELRHIHHNTDIQVTTVNPYLIKTGMFSGCSSKLKYIFHDLEPDYVADKIVSAIMRNQIQLCIGRLMYFLIFIKSFLPVNAIYELDKLAGSNSFLKSFIDIRKEKRQTCYEKLKNS